MSRIGPARVRLPEKARRGEVIEIRTLVQHPMESGFRLDNTGQPIARHIVETLTCTYNGKEIFFARIHPAISANPYLTFYARITDGGEFIFTWKDDQGGVTAHTARIEVTA
ncbi:MAG: thiosulfate oxidation carrier complex protein SoxZ [Burkholderiales bacterium]